MKRRTWIYLMGAPAVGVAMASACNPSNNGGGTGGNAACTAVDGSILTSLSVDAGDPVCQSCINAKCTPVLSTCAKDCTCNSSALAALSCIEGLSGSASVSSLASCVSDLTGSSANDLVMVGQCLDSCSNSCVPAGSHALPDGGCSADATVSAYLSDGGACSACVVSTCAQSLAACNADCSCNRAIVGAVECLAGLGTSASVVSTTACVSPVLASSDPNVLSVGECLASSCSSACGLAGPESGVSDSGEAAVSDGGPSDADAARSPVGDAAAGTGSTLCMGYDPSVGGIFTCRVEAGGSVECWGSNGLEELGRGPLIDDGGQPAILAPGAVTGVTNAVAVTCGFGFACALIADGTVACWGTDVGQQLGSAALVPSYDGSGGVPNGPDASPPVLVAGLSDAVAVGAGQDFACVLRATGEVECWGDLFAPGLLPLSSQNVVVPTPIPGLAGVTAIAVGNDGVCGLLSNQMVECVGWLNPLPVETTTPTAVPSLTGAKAIFSGSQSINEVACAVVAGGAVSCWGGDPWLLDFPPSSEGQPGGGGTWPLPTPVTIPGLSGAVAVSVGDETACALLSNGDVACWGRYVEGELGGGYYCGQTCYGPPGLPNVGTPTDPVIQEYLNTPVVVLSGAVAVTVGEHAACAELAGGGVDCWGLIALGLNGSGAEYTSACEPGGASVLQAVSELGVPATTMTLDEFGPCEPDIYANSTYCTSFLCATSPTAVPGL